MEAAPGSGRFLLDLKGIRYDGELVELPVTAALVRLKPSGDEMVSEWAGDAAHHASLAACSHLSATHAHRS